MKIGVDKDIGIGPLSIGADVTTEVAIFWNSAAPIVSLIGRASIVRSIRISLMARSPGA
jgi:hypothetical protein